jgi:hypothetical protein
MLRLSMPMRHSFCTAQFLGVRLLGVRLHRLVGDQVCPTSRSQPALFLSIALEQLGKRFPSVSRIGTVYALA